MALGSKNRVDILVLPPSGGSVRIEVEWFPRASRKRKRRASVLAHGLGQAALALAHRDLAVMVIGCSAARGREAQELHRHLVRACRGSRNAGSRHQVIYGERPGFRAPGRDLPS
jgi:hypothetical protein